MKNWLKFIFMLGTLVLTFGCNSQTKNMDFSTVDKFDLEKYLGTWYEIARFDHRFERDLEGVTATYSVMDNGKIKVVNKGYEDSLNGELNIAEGKAKITDQPGYLKVSFFWFFYADYRVMELGENYQWALVGSNSDKYLWILSREPQLSRETINNILQHARNRGFDTSKLIWVEQPPN
jgi:lipocalin